MRIAIASGKGGTGKTTIAVSLFLTLAEQTVHGSDAVCQLLDCDVEEPNAAIFAKPVIEGSEEVGIRLPEVDFDLCTYCGRCAEVCAYHAIAVFGDQLLIFPQLCHGCGSCTHNCPEGAIHEVLSPTGTLSWGTIREQPALRFGQGEMIVGEAMATPIIRQLKRKMRSVSRESVTILDAPPGNACPVVETMRGADFALLVTEPTPFGLHDLRIAVDVASEELGVPVGVVINRDGVGDGSVDEFCAERGVPILLRIPLDRRIAETYADGIPLVEALPEYRSEFADLYASVVALIEGRDR
ncbi:MAG: ATP-binding protein [Anaerolineae bacterium]